MSCIQQYHDNSRVISTLPLWFDLRLKGWYLSVPGKFLQFCAIVEISYCSFLNKTFSGRK